MSNRFEILNYIHNTFTYDTYLKTYKFFDCLNYWRDSIKSKIIFEKSSKQVKPLEYYSVSDRILYPCNIPDNKFFEETTINFCNKDILVNIFMSDHGYYIKPIDKINKFQFEEFFGFGHGCSGFYKNKVVYIPYSEKNFY
jgi:hypothetical protein